MIEINKFIAALAFIVGVLISIAYGEWIACAGFWIAGAILYSMKETKK